MRRKKRAFTLLEIMIVIFLITLISGVIGYNMLGTLDRGKAFRTEQAISELHDLLLLCVADGEGAEEVARSPLFYLKKYNLAKNPDKLIKDGWNEPLVITAYKSDFDITSKHLTDYNRNLGKAPPVKEPKGG